MTQITLSHGLLDLAGQLLMDAQGQPLTMHAVCQQVVTLALQQAVAFGTPEIPLCLQHRAILYRVGEKLQGDEKAPIELSAWERVILMDAIDQWGNGLVAGRLRAVLDA